MIDPLTFAFVAVLLLELCVLAVLWLLRRLDARRCRRMNELYPPDPKLFARFGAHIKERYRC